MKRILLLVLFAAALAIAQSSGVLVGVITTPSGEPVRHARIVLVDVESGVRRETTTDKLGIYAFSLLPPGEYRLESVDDAFVPLTPGTTSLKDHDKRSWRLVWAARP